MSNTTPTLETLAGLYKAAWQAKHETTFAFDRIREAITRHGFTEEQVRAAAAIYPITPTKDTPELERENTKLRLALADAISTFREDDKTTIVSEERQEAWIAALKGTE